MGRTERIRINSAHSILWYFEKNTTSKYPDWRDALIHFFFQLYQISNKNYAVDIVLKLVDGLDILYNRKLVCFIHVRQRHILLHLHKDCLLFKHSLTKKFKTEHKGSWEQMFKITTKEELKVILDYLRKQKVLSRTDYHKSRRIPSKIREIVWDRDKGRCRNCGSTNDLHFDHDIPHSKGGSSMHENNIQILCAKCNRSKGNRKFM